MELFGSAVGWIIALLLIGIILFIHESGHYLMAVWNGVKIEEFGFGMPPRIWKMFTWRGTIFSINAIPFGAFVRPAGEDDPDVPGGLSSASKRVRILVMLGGVTANLIAGIAAYTVVAKLAYPDGVIIQQVADNSPAQTAGILPGDKVVSVDGEMVESVESLIAYIHQHLGEQIDYVVERESETLALKLIPREEWPADQGPTGVVLGIAYSDQHSWGESFLLALRTIWSHFLMLLRLPVMILQGEIGLNQGRPIGPVGLVDITEQIVQTATKYDQWIPLLYWFGGINIALCIGNLLPIPALDGGRLMFILLEAIRGKRLEPSRERAMIAITFFLLLGCLGVVTILDLLYPVLPR